MTRVTHVLWSGGIGGIERLVHDLALAQRAAGTDVSVAFGRAEGPFADRLSGAGIPIHDLAFRSGYDVRPHTVARARRLLGDADVLHVHGLNVPLIAATQARAMVYTDHGSVPVRRTPALTAKRLVQRAAIARAGAVTAPSEYAADRCAAIHRVPRSRVTVVPNGIAASGPVAERAYVEGLVVAVVGRLSKSKRVARAFEALARVERPDVRMVVAGSGPLRDELGALAERVGIAQRVEFLGTVLDVQEVYAEADVLVLAAPGEIFGLVVVEAAAAGVLPIVFADSGGAREILPPDGMVVRDEAELASTLAMLPGDARLGAGARKARAAWARETFAIGRAVERFATLYADVLRRA